MDLVAELARAGATVEELVLDLLAPVQREVGLRWERREWSVAEEHAATAIVDVTLAMVTLDEPPSDGRHVVVACVEGEWHSLTARMAAEIFRHRGWSVTFLGPSVPPGDLGAYAAESAPDAVALSSTLPILLPGARRCIAACRDQGVPVLAGGPGFGPDGRYAGLLGADGWEPGAVAGTARLDRWLESPPQDRLPGLDPDEEQQRLEDSRTDLVARALQRAPAGDDAVRSALEMAVSALESAALVADPELLVRCGPMVEREMPDVVGRELPWKRILAGLLGDVRLRSPRAAAVVEAALA
jgi:methanogenic corrinoid protein MtbC1